MFLSTKTRLYPGVPRTPEPKMIVIYLTITLFLLSATALVDRSIKRSVKRYGQSKPSAEAEVWSKLFDHMNKR
jgi:hypothetical protein